MPPVTSMISVSLLFLILYVILPQASAGKKTSKPRTTKTVANVFNGNYFIGTHAVYGPEWNKYRISPYDTHSYSESGFDMLSEFRDSVAVAGMNHFKLKLSPNVCESYALTCNSKDISSLTELSQVSEIAKTFADPRFLWYHIWGYSFSLPRKLNEPFTQDQLDQEYNEVYFWAAHMLETYKNTKKVFFLGNWEGDWELMWSSNCRTPSGSYNLTCVPSEDNIAKYIEWTKTRQAAINAAKRDYGTNGVNVFFYIEFNLGEENFEAHPSLPGVPRPTMLNSVVPLVNPDFISYSSYKSTNKYMDHKGQYFNQTRVDEKFWSVLDHAQSKLQTTSTNLTSVLGDMSKRVFIGEFSPVNTREPSLFVPSAAQVFRAALQWGCPFVLHWAAYDNDSNAVPLVPRDNKDIYTLSPMRQFFKNWTDAAHFYVLSKNPTSNQLRLWAVEWFRSKY